MKTLENVNHAEAPNDTRSFAVEALGAPALPGGTPAFRPTLPAHEAERGAKQAAPMSEEIDYYAGVYR